MTTWAEIAQKAQEASGGDRELEVRVHLELRPELWDEPWEQHQLGYWLRMDGQPRGVVAPHYTTSVDAVLGLVAEKLQGWQVDTIRQEDEEWHAALDRIEPFQTTRARSSTPALALLAAFALAMQAEEGVQGRLECAS